MKEVRIFIASSIKEFEWLRVYCGDYVRRLNEEQFNHSVSVKLHLCEDEELNSQAIYDRRIENSHIFIGLIGEKLGEFTKHEICEVANTERGSKILAKTLFVTKDFCSQIETLNLSPTFTINVVDSEPIQKQVKLYEKVKAFIETTIDVLKDNLHDVSCQQEGNRQTINIPKFSDKYEYAILSNILRVINERDCPIRVIEGETKVYCDNYVSLLTIDPQQETQRLDYLLSKLNIDIDNLWLLAQEPIRDPSIDSYCSKLVRQYQKYPDFYKDYSIFSLLIKNKLLEYIVKNQDVFLYEVCDHWLCRKGMMTGKLIPIKNLIWEDVNMHSLQQKRRERVIENVMNLYVTSKNTKKLKAALWALESNDYDFFINNPRELKEERQIPVDSYIDYIFDRQDQICKRSYHDNEIIHIKQGIEEIETYIHSIAHFRMESIDYFNLYNQWANAAMYFADMNYALKLFTKAYEFVNECDERVVLEHNEIVFACIINVCDIHYRMQNIKELIKWTEYVEVIANRYNNCVCFIYYIVYKARAYQDKNKSKVLSYFDLAIKNLQKDELYKDNNSLLNLYIELKLEKMFYLCYKEPQSISNYEREAQLLTKEYQNYLSNSDYNITKALLLTLNALIKNNEEKCDEAIVILKNINENVSESFSRKARYYKSYILQNLEKNSEALDILLELIEVEKKIPDLATYYQNIADIYVNMKEYRSAIEAYQKAIEKFEEIKEIDFIEDKIGNCLDGISWSYLLLGNFCNAREYAEKAVAIEKYTFPKKECNLISALLCQNHYWRARRIYKESKFKKHVREQLIMDWDDLNKNGVKTSFFKYIFIGQQ